DGLLRFLENFLGLIANYIIGDLHVHGFDRSRTGTGLSLVSAESAILKGGEPGSLGCEAHVGREFSLKHLAGEDELFAFVLETDAVADYGASQSRRQLGDEVAHLIRVRHQHQLWLPRTDELLERCNEGV